jgi:hypothetical protein
MMRLTDSGTCPAGYRAKHISDSQTETRPLGDEEP